MSRPRVSDLSLRVILEFTTDAKDLAVLPWEYLYRPDSPDEEGAGFFIAARNDLILSRQVPFRDLPDEPWVQDDELRILSIVSRPKDERVVKAEPVIELLEIMSKESNGSVRLELLNQPTKERFENALRDFQPHIVHFIGHGTYKQGRGSLGFVNEETGGVTWVDDETFADYFRGGRTRLVFLQSCEGARSDAYDDFSGVALRLVGNRVPAVIAMHYEISNKVAAAFAKTFYDSLREGQAIDQAVQRGRRVVGTGTPDGRNFDDRAFGCPVVYLQSVDDMDDKGVIVFPTARVAARWPAQPHVAVGDVRPCPATGCPGRVELGKHNFCKTCHSEIAQCPGCGSPYIPQDHSCAFCGWKPGKAPAPAEAARAGEAPWGTAWGTSDAASATATRAGAGARDGAWGTPTAPLSTAGRSLDSTDERPRRPWDRD